MVTTVYVITVLMMTSLTSFSMTSAETNEQKVTRLETMIGDLSRQAMLQQLFIDERMRSEGQSGVKAVHAYRTGTRPYFGVTFQDGFRVAGIRDEPHKSRRVGQAEATYVFNGVQFRTGRNYDLRMPSTKSKSLHAEENIPFPDVPPSVLDKNTVEEQMAEMKEYFRAFKNQNKHRDYRPYFRPVLCYLEGAWFTNDKSDAKGSILHHNPDHFLEHQENKLKTFEAAETSMGQFVYSPTLIYNVTDGIPQFAVWKSRTACHPISQDIRLGKFHPIDDLAPRIANRLTPSEFQNTPLQRFSLYGKKDASYEQWGLPDDLMYEVPGKDNYPGNLTYSDFGMDFFFPGQDSSILRADRYSRWFRVFKKGAMGTRLNHRFFSDTSLFVAMTSHPEVAPMRVTHCERGKRHKTCDTFEARMTYALPLEVIYLSPLHSWNPHKLPYHHGNVKHGNRSGGFHPGSAFEGFNDNMFFFTPAEFFSSSQLTEDPKADTEERILGVLDRQGHVRKVVASGVRTFLPELRGLGSLRMRYPIVPVHQEGSAAWRELDALKEMLMDLSRWQRYF